MTEFGKSPDGSKFKAVKRGGALIFRWSKRIIRLFTLGVALYGLCQTVEVVTPLAVVLVALMIVGWILQIIFLSGTSLLQPIKIGSPMPLNF